MADDDVLLDALTAFARTMTGHFQVGDVLDELTTLAAAVLDADGAGVCLADEQGSLQFATASNDAVTRLERVQQERQEGPCWDAHRTGTPTLVTDIEDRTEWPAYRAMCLEVDMRSVAGIPMWWNGTGLGALNLYRTHPGAWTDRETAAAGVLADMATSYVAHASQLDEANRLNEQLQEALTSRILIEQAKGLLAGERNISLNDAYEVLRRHARSNHASLRAVASAVVELGFRP